MSFIGVVWFEGQPPGLALEFTSRLALCNRQGEPEGGAFTNFALDPDITAMGMDSEAAERQPNAEPAGLVLSAQACKFFKDAFSF
jgi:hypothetical protein